MSSTDQLNNPPPNDEALMVDEDDEQITLPTDTHAILQQFLREKAEREELESKSAQLAGAGDSKKPSFDTFEENWVRLLHGLFPANLNIILFYSNSN